MEGNMPGEEKKKTCFVVMGFGEKTDFQSSPQRVLDLNKTYEYIIEPSVTEAGLECIRADKIVHSGVIDKPMYEQLLAADLVVADLSTSNVNAVYELGVRHALRPHATIVMAESNFKFPFDLNHLTIMQYEHLGKEIGFGEVNRVRKILKEKIAVITAKEETDSPVFLFLPAVVSALDRAQVAAAADAAPAAAPTAKPLDTSSFAELMDDFRAAKAAVKNKMDWIKVTAFLERLQKMQPEDPYVIQQLALATYKCELPDPLTALQGAKKILEVLAPNTSSDAETVGLWGAIHKRLWQVGQQRDDLDRAIGAYQRGFYIKNDYYNGINYAFLLDLRASISAGDDATADRVVARRARTRVLANCDDLLKTGGFPPADKFWIEATRAEALLGLGRKADAEAFKATVFAGKPEQWMMDSWASQMAALEKLLPAA
jgi:tetratricopeptide (TPR) repeat protein